MSVGEPGRGSGRRPPPAGVAVARLDASRTAARPQRRSWLRVVLWACVLAVRATSDADDAAGGGDHALASRPNRTAAPRFDPTGQRKWAGSVQVRLSCDTPGATVRYTTTTTTAEHDGGDGAAVDDGGPRDGWAVASGDPIVYQREGNVTFRAFASAPGLDDSPVVSHRYEIQVRVVRRRFSLVRFSARLPRGWCLVLCAVGRRCETKSSRLVGEGGAGSVVTTFKRARRRSPPHSRSARRRGSASAATSCNATAAAAARPSSSSARST